MGDCDTLLDAVAREVDNALPPLEPVSDEALQEFVALMGMNVADLTLAAHLRAESTSHY